MAYRTKTVYSFILLALVLTASCGFNQQSRFQNSFLPAAPIAAAASLEPAPAVAQPNVYLKDIPPFLVVQPTMPERETKGDLTAKRAEQVFQHARRLYQGRDIEGARREFDSAVDLMLQASEESPLDREQFERKLEKMVDDIHRMDLAGMGASAAVEEGKFEKAPLEDILQMTFPVDPKLKIRVLDQVKATVSQLPLSVNDTVLGYINYFSNRGRGTIRAAMQRSGRYRPMIQRILDEEGLPQELLHLAQAESGFIPRAVSRMAAGGMWQFVTSRGHQYDLMQTPYTDDRMDPEKATRAAARHLRDLYSEFGDWYLAIAAYNCGPGAVEKAVERTGYADFWELRRLGTLPAETTNYVPIILAMTIMEKNAAEYGLEGITLDPPLEYDTIEISGPTSLTLVSDILEISPSQLAELNPAVLRNLVPDHFALHVPKGTSNQLQAALQLVPLENRGTWRMHTVGSGETLASVGRSYGVTPSAIIAANDLKSGEAMEGDRLLIPSAPRVEARARSAGTTARPQARSTRSYRRAATKTSKPARKGSVVVARAGR